MDKTALRQLYQRIRAGLGGPSLQKENDRIAQRLQSLVNWAAVRRVHVYDPNLLWNEVDTRWFTDYVRKEWPEIELTVGKATPNQPLPEQEYDLIIVPVVAFDEDCFRLGMGGGWYDRFLASQPTAVSIGVAFEAQEIASVPIEPHDIRLTCIVTPKRTIEAPAGAS